jgi:hypothetical protein
MAKTLNFVNGRMNYCQRNRNPSALVSRYGLSIQAIRFIRFARNFGEKLRETWELSKFPRG